MEVSVETRTLIKQLTKLGFDNGVKTFFLVEEITNSILRTYYEKDGEIKFPINIRGIIDEFHIEIAEMALNVDLGFRIDRVNGYLRKLGAENKWRIYIEYDDSEFTKRYILAHEFSHYLLRAYAENDSVSDNATDYCVDPMLPKRRTELLADIMAAYFLLPYKPLLEEMIAYTKWMESTNSYPIDAVQMMRSIGNHAQISSYHTFMSYQYRKYYFCYLYNMYENERTPEIEELLKKYAVLFK